jgi:hypothetical protein
MSSAPGTQTQSANAGTVKEWFWRGHALKDAKSASKASTVSRERLRRARLAAEFAGRMIDPAEPWYDGSALPLAISLYREAAYWVLLAHSDAEEPTTLRELLASGGYPTGDLSEADASLVKDVLGEKTFVQTADESGDALRRQAVLCRTFVHGLIRSELAADRKVTRVLVQRLLRIGVVALAVLGVALAINAAVQRAIRGPDLAAGKSWTASSKAFDCNPAEKSCGGAHTAIFFHTLEEVNPWVQIDLGARKKFRRVRIENRDDCCEDRAVPLVVETSNDGNEFREVGRRTDAFDDWDATFDQVTARYVRVRADRKTYLHLAHVGVHAR